MNWPKISIVTPSFNQGAFIEETIDSVLSQNYPNLEYIIVDGGSTDSSVEIIKRYEKHLAYWVSEPDSGQSHAINKGLSRATGDVFNWLNSDDYYAAGALQKVGEQFSDASLKVLAGRSNIVMPDKTSFRSKGTDVFRDNLAKTIGWARIDQPETFIRKTCIDQLGGVNAELQYLMDRDLWIRYLLRFGFSGIRETEDILVNFRIHDHSKTGSQGEAFNEERDRYFFSLAKKGGKNEKADIIRMTGDEQMLNIEGLQDSQLLDRVLDYFLVKLGEEQYRNNARKNARIIFDAVDPTNLDRETQSLLRTLRFRNQYIPLWLIRFFRRRHKPA